MNLISYLTLDNFKKAIIFFLPIVATFFVSRYTITKPNKFSIKEKQLHNVYIPLYRIFCLTPQIHPSTRLLARYSAKLKSITTENYELVFPHLYYLSELLYQSLRSNNLDSLKIFRDIQYQISKDYHLLKRDLGYPTQSLFSVLTGINLKDSIHYVCGKISFPSFVAFLLSPIIKIIDSIFNTNLVLPFMSLSILVFFTSTLLYIILSSDDNNKQYRI